MLLFTYDPTGINQVHRLREEIGDTVFGSGCRPVQHSLDSDDVTVKGNNFADVTLQNVLNDENGNIVHATTRMTRMLQLEWSAYCASLGTKVKTENLRQAEAYRDAYVQMIADFGRPTFGNANPSSRRRSHNGRTRPRRRVSEREMWRYIR